MAAKKTPGDVTTPAGSDIEFTQEIQPEPVATKKKAPAKSSSGKMSFEEMQQKLCRTMNFIAFVTKSEKTFADADFIEEAKDLARLSTKYETVSTVIALLDPLFFIFGMVSKVKEVMAARPVKPQPEPGPADLAPGINLQH